jgi:hypothetical protein
MRKGGEYLCGKIHTGCARDRKVAVNNGEGGEMGNDRECCTMRTRSGLVAGVCSMISVYDAAQCRNDAGT